MLPLPQTALAAVRTEASNRQAAALASGFLHNLIAGGVLPEGSECLAVDQKKIHRAREEVMKQIQDKEEMRMQEEKIGAIMVDSRQYLDRRLFWLVCQQIV